MEFAVLACFIALAAALIVLPGRAEEHDAVGAELQALETLRTERSRLLAELRELDDDAAMGRIAAEDRLAGRRNLAPRLRAVNELLREGGDEGVRNRAQA